MPISINRVVLAIGIKELLWVSSFLAAAYFRSVFGFQPHHTVSLNNNCTRIVYMYKMPSKRTLIYFCLSLAKVFIDTQKNLCKKQRQEQQMKCKNEPGYFSNTLLSFTLHNKLEYTIRIQRVLY